MCLRTASTNPTRPKPYRNVCFEIARACLRLLQHDGVSWNNNLAEDAIKRISNYREDVGRSVKEAGLTEHLVLLSLYQTCRVRDVSFLKFLLSRERDVDVFGAGKRRGDGGSVLRFIQRAICRPRSFRFAGENCEREPHDDRGNRVTAFVPRHQSNDRRARRRPEQCCRHDAGWVVLYVANMAAAVRGAVGLARATICCIAVEARNWHKRRSTNTNQQCRIIGVKQT